MSETNSDLGASLDRISIATGRAASWLTLAMVLVTFVIVVLRYVFDVGLIWLQAAASTSRHIRDERASLTHLGVIDGVSSEAYDMHTQVGRRALAYFSKACEPVREYLTCFVRERDVQQRGYHNPTRLLL